MVEFDPKFIKEQANRLYAQSKSVIPSHFFIGLLLGLLIFNQISNYFFGTFDFLIVAIGVLIGAFMGLGSGYHESKELKLRAQKLLCLVKQEENSRR